MPEPFTSPTMGPTEPGFGYSAQIRRLAQLVKELEAGTLDFETSVQHFEEGMAISKNCQRYLEAAELKVTQIIKTAEGYTEQAFEVG